MKLKSSTNDEDLRLVIEFINGDKAAFEKLVHKYMDKVYSIAYKMIANQEDAKDISQEAFIRVYKSIRNFRWQSNFYTWLYRIVTNLCIDHLRNTRTHEHLAIDEIVTTNPYSTIEFKELQKDLHSAINSLAPHYRSCVVLHDIHGLSYKEIASVLRIPMGTVMSRLSHARKLLREKLKDYIEK